MIQKQTFVMTFVNMITFATKINIFTLHPMQAYGNSFD